MLVQSRFEFGGGAKSEQSAAVLDSPRSTKKSPPARILVVDDEPLVRWSVSERLGDEGYEVAEAGDAASAIRAFSTLVGGVDAVLLDPRLPDSDDLRVLSAIRGLAPATPVILMTAYVNPELRAEARRLGAFAIVDKPFEMDALPPLVEQALAAQSR